MEGFIILFFIGALIYGILERADGVPTDERLVKFNGNNNDMFDDNHNHYDDSNIDDIPYYFDITKNVTDNMIYASDN